ncbi:MAG: hypothetical protein ACK5V3_08055 [Bdellovibrionales bacterium]
MQKIKNTLKFSLLSILLTTLFSLTWPVMSHGQTLKSGIFTTTQGTKLFAASHILNPNQPTLILLPGIYRGYLPDEAILKSLTQRGHNWVSLHLSRHPESVLGGSTFVTGLATSKELASEVVQVKRALQIKKPILVSLSYSGTLSPFWNRQEFPVLIETSPMGRHDESKQTIPALEAWQQWMNLFPVWGPLVVQTNEFWGYRGYWLQKTEELTQTHPRYNSLKIKIAEGLAQLAWATRGFDIRTQDFSKGPERFWILGANELPVRLRYQLEAVEIHKRITGQSNRLFLIQNAGHIVPGDQLELYIQALEKVLKRARFQ